ncbi:unnamed protein product [Cylicocyclus nassatus]|uniref:G-protein coupled receptors family 1 profile domain-containing protein n=1 Tax=Cylicocyclus nassatus TaxID=53992 RepID=A0AA36H2K6_CYLNA|nr:unnamed protein product [Cylicocyclus nassatus]
MDEWCENKAVLIPTIVILAIIFVIGGAGNICTCVVIIRTKTLHTRPNYFLLVLACSDMLLLFLGCPLEMYHLISCFTSSKLLCKFWFYVREAYGSTSVMTICAFTAERWLAVRHPLRMKLKLRTFCCALAAISNFALSVVTGFRMYVVSAEIEISENKTTEKCVGSVSKFIECTTIIIFILSYLIPVVMLATMCFQIAAFASPTTCTIQTECSRKAPLKTNRLLVAVVISFLICWSPHHIVQLITAFFIVESEESVWEVIISTSACCYYLNCAVNPILYNMFSEKFREAFLHMVNQGRVTATAKIFW